MSDNASPANEQPSKLIVHHLSESRSQRILWLLEELGVPYEIQKYSRTHDMRAPKELLAVNPLGKAPVITDDNLNLSESGAIVEYLIGKYGKGNGQPPESGRIDNLFYSHYAEGSLAPVLIMKFMFTYIPKAAPFFIRFVLRGIFNQIDKVLVEPELKRHGAMIEAQLAKTGGWFAGGDDPTSADYLMMFPLELLAKLDPENLGPETTKYLARTHARPAYIRAIEKGGTYTLSKL